jgi:hypothetical protein
MTGNGHRAIGSTVVSRFLSRLFIVAVIAPVSSYGMAEGAAMICAICGGFCFGMALLRKERPISTAFTYWDEGAWFAALACFACWFA